MREVTLSTTIDGIDYGPLAGLIGTWQGDSGMDVSPEPDGDDHNPYFETLTFDAAGDVDNAETQELVSVRYTQVVTRKRDGKVFHNEAGYLIWDADNQLLMQTLSIPRGLALVAGGQVTSADGATVFIVAAGDGEEQWPIAQSPFLSGQARTKYFRHTIELKGDQLKYQETMNIEIYGSAHEHTDENVLTRVG